MIIQTTFSSPDAFLETLSRNMGAFPGDAVTSEMEDFVICLRATGRSGRRPLAGMDVEERIIIMKSFVESGYAVPCFRQTRLGSGCTRSRKTKTPGLTTGRYTQSAVIRHCGLGERLLRLLDATESEEDGRIRNLLLGIIEEGRIYWLGFFGLSLEEKKLLMGLFVRAGILTPEIDPTGIVYAVSFTDLGQGRHSCLLHAVAGESHDLYFRSLKDASALADSWSLGHSSPAVVDRLYLAGGEMRIEEVGIVRNDYRGQDWAPISAPFEPLPPPVIRA